MSILGQATDVAISQLHIWNGLWNTQTTRCSSSAAGDILPWRLFGDAEIDGAYLDIPSQCDG